GATTINGGTLAVVGAGSIGTATAVNNSAAATPSSAGSQLRGTGTVNNAVTATDVVANSNAGVWPGVSLDFVSLPGNEVLTVSSVNLSANGRFSTAIRSGVGVQRLVTTAAAVPSVTLNDTSVLSFALS